MILVDVNLLLYAYDAESPLHQRAQQWLEKSFSGSEAFCFAWISLTAFIRISTNLRVFHYPLSLADAVQVVDEWLQRPNAVILNPGDQHWKIFSKYLKESQAAGPLATDAHLAALAVEHGAIFSTNDRDFSRFKGLKLAFPLEE
jgi:toxin-antitoxin system PIN domain toxin